MIADRMIKVGSAGAEVLLRSSTRYIYKITTTYILQIHKNILSRPRLGRYIYMYLGRYLDHVVTSLISNSNSSSSSRLDLEF